MSDAIAAQDVLYTPFGSFREPESMATIRKYARMTKGRQPDKRTIAGRKYWELFKSFVDARAAEYCAGNTYSVERL